MMRSAADNRIPPDRLPALVATAAVLQLSESMLPHPVPGLRLGLANIVSLIILFQYGFRPALTVTLLRTVVSSFILGSFLSPGFFLSFIAGFAGLSVSALLHRGSQHLPFLRLSPIGVSVIGAFVHNMTQLLLAYLLFFHHPGIFYLVPWLTFGSVALGVISGTLAVGVLNRLAEGREAGVGMTHSTPPFTDRIFLPGDSPVHRCAPEIKIGAILAVTLLTVFVENLILYGTLFVLVLLGIAVSAVGFAHVFAVVRKLWAIILGVFLLPLYFNHGSQDFLSTPFGVLHQEAVMAGVVYSSRIILLALVSNLVARTTEVDAFAKGIRAYLKPFDVVGCNSREIADTISQSLTALPRVWFESRSMLTTLMAGRPKNLSTIKDVAIELFHHLFAFSKNP